MALQNESTADEASVFFCDYYRQQHENLLRTLYRLTRDWSTAEDALQHAFTTLYAQRGTLDLGRPLKNLVVTVALNHVRKAFRRHRLERWWKGVRGRQNSTADARPHDALQEKDRATQIERMIAELGSDEQAILILYYYEHLSYQDIAQTLDMPLGTVKWKMHYAIHALRPKLEAVADGL